MKKALSLFLSLFLLLWLAGCSCAPQETEDAFPLKPTACIYTSSIGSMVLGDDGKLWATADLFPPQDGTVLYAEPITEAQLAVFDEERRADIRAAELYFPENGIYNYRLLAENVADFLIYGSNSSYVLFTDGLLKKYARNNETGEPAGTALLEKVTALSHDGMLTFLLEDGRMVKPGAMEGYETIEALDGSSMYVQAENVRSFHQGTYIDREGVLWANGPNVFGFRAIRYVDELTIKEVFSAQNYKPPYDPGYGKVLTGAKFLRIQWPVIGAAIREDDSLWMWGANEFGTIGNGECGDGYFDTREVVTEPYRVLENVADVIFCSNTIVIEENMSTDAVIALTKDGDVYTWGSNQVGWLGNGQCTCGEYDVMLGCVAEPVKILSGIRQIYRVFGEHETSFMALSETGDLYMWGGSICGECGCGVQRIPYNPTARTQPEYLVTTPTKILENVVLIGGRNNCAAVTADGTVWGWGRNPFNMPASREARGDELKPHDGQNLVIFSEPTRNPQISAIIGEDGSVSFVPAPVE